MTTKNGRALMALALEGAVWKKSSYSAGGESQCVETADLTGTVYAAIAVRDSKAPQGPALVFPVGGWSSFVSAVRGGEFPVI